jgi:ABC-type glycerol-3-phosphate transport system permease component
MFIGLIIIVIGLVLLMQNMGFVSSEIWNVIWPSIIILFGISLLMKRNARREKWERFGEKMEKAGKKLEKTFKEKTK